MNELQISEDILKTRSRIAELQSFIQQQEQIALEPKHHFSEGLYARELFLPQGSIVIGKIHKHAHLNVIMYGRVTVTTPFGTEDLEGPLIFESKPDTKRAVYAHLDTLWITFHPTEETDVDVIESQIILKDYSDQRKLSSSEQNLLEGDIK